MTSFESLNLNNPLRNALADLGFTHATPIQAAAFSTIMSGRDVVGIAQTGTGKTYAYLLPILRMLPFSKQNQPRVLIIVPTRELVLQIVEEAQKLCTYTSIRVGGVYGGTNMNTQKQVVADGLDILVATPGRLLDLAYTGVLKLKSVQKLVLDEVDELLNLGFRPQLITLLDLLPEKKQHLLFSATMLDDVESMIKDYFNDPVFVEVTPPGTPVDQIDQRYYVVPNFYSKLAVLRHLLLQGSQMTKVLIFANTKYLADLIYEGLETDFPNAVGVIHSNKSQNFRINSITQFQNGSYRFLIATDVIARGLDIDGITHVINFDLPEENEVYVHRIGRTGRAEKQGVSITFIKPIELDQWEDIETLMDFKVGEWPIPQGVELSDALLEIEKPTVAGKNLNPKLTLKHSQGAFHQKKDKNIKTNKALERRKAYKEDRQKRKSQRKRK